MMQNEMRLQNVMTMKDAVIAYWTKAFDFSGRARRREYWLNVLAMFIIGVIAWLFITVIDVATASRFQLIEHFNFFMRKILPYITTIPNMAQASRRLQDINLNGKIAIIIIASSTIISFLTDHVFNVLPLATNHGTPAFLILAALLAISWVFLFICNFIPGTNGDNRYGKDPKIS